MELNSKKGLLIKKKFLYRELDSWIDINATKSEVWKTLIDFVAWKDWNSFIPVVEGRFELGETMEIKVVSPGMKAMTFKPKIYEIEPYEKISWGGGFMGLIYKGIHIFLLEYIAEDITRFRQIEKFEGPIVLLMDNMINKTGIGYQNMNEEFKKYVEEKVISSV